MADELCPLCGKSEHMAKAKPLYNHMVCKKCYYGFANRRQLAFFLDGLFWQILMFPLFFMFGFALAALGYSEEFIETTPDIAGFASMWLFICKDGISGYSPGKAIMGVRVIDRLSGEPIGFWASFKRNLPLIIPFMPLVVGFSLCKGDRTGDGWARSKVIWKKYASHPIFLAESNASPV
jgi:uncharacterized RDD family membrane protein YckC